ncbi:UNKNOWN [Stylonychia lemnae]|uniref:Uncharacterized protein n=1 Tax=Stylonychia lemnae TaxID=5949 RepID=A0A078B782_STYLE|nr:UNKNOWN [Stylonychia lemnae]|eukprot:CDW89162.1 UNKNOWN [Stylonychia lemnae]
MWLRTGQGYELSKEPQISQWIRDESFKYGPNFQVKYVGDDPRLVKVETYERICYKTLILNDTGDVPVTSERVVEAIYKIEEFTEEYRIGGMSGDDIDNYLTQNGFNQLSVEELAQLVKQHEQREEEIQQNDKVIDSKDEQSKEQIELSINEIQRESDVKGEQKQAKEEL